MASLLNQFPSVSTAFAIFTSLSAIKMLLRNIINEFLPSRTREYITLKLGELFSSYLNSSFTFVIEQRWQSGENQTFLAAQAYLPKCLARLSTKEVLVGSCNLKNPSDEQKLGIPLNTKIIDEFEGIHLEWTLHSIESTKSPFQERKYFQLTCKKEFRDKILKDYFTHLAKSAQKIKKHRKNLNIYTYNQRSLHWQSVVFEHHSTFETLAIEQELKTSLINDLDTFSKGKDFFKSVGRAWKRGYLLYGPPGTGKSSLVAAIANHMRYHIYDLQIQSISNDAELRKILISTLNRSILLIEDIDCGADVSSRRLTNESDHEEVGDDAQKGKKKDVGISLSGLLNFVDGLWSSCGEERIIIFTTNHKEKLDPALLRPGRMDMHIHMNYCTPFVFKKLVSMYLKIDDHVLFKPIENLIIEVSTTPAEVTQQLMGKNNFDLALKSLLKFLEVKKRSYKYI